METSSALSPEVRRPVRTRLGRALIRRRRLRTGIVQLLYLFAAIGLAALVPQADTGDFRADADRTSQILLSAGAGVLAFTGVTYSLLFLVVQFGTTNYTPRLNLFRDSPIVWHAFSFFVAVFAYCFVAPFVFSDEDQVTALVPMLLAVFLIAALAVFRALQQTALWSIQLAAVLEATEKRGRDVVNGVYPEPFGRVVIRQPAQDEGERPREDVRWTGRMAVLQAVDVPRLLQLASHHNAVIECRVEIGDTLKEGEVVAHVHGATAIPLGPAILRQFETGSERNFEQDPALALRVLVDIACRSLSNAINDPTTATQALDRIDSLLRHIAWRDLHIHRIDDVTGSSRVVLRLPSWEDYVGLAFDEILIYGARSPLVTKRLVRILEGLVEFVPEQRRRPIAVRLDEAKLLAVAMRAERRPAIDTTHARP